MAGFCCVRGPTKVHCVTDNKVNHFRRFMISAVDHKTRCFRFVKQNLCNSAGDHHTVNVFAIAKSLKVFLQRFRFRSCVCLSKLNKYLCSTLIERQKITLIHRFLHLQKLNLSTDSKLGVERLRKKSVYPWQSKISELNKLTSCSSQMHKRTFTVCQTLS